MLNVCPVVALFWVQIVHVLEPILDIGLRALIPAGLSDFFSHIHANEEFVIRDQLRNSVQLPQGTVSTAN